MTTINIKSKKSKALINNKIKNRSIKKEEKNEGENKVNSSLLFIITFFTIVLLIVSTYAWFSASLDVKIKFFNLSVSTDNGLFISLDGINFDSSLDISMNSIITDIRNTYQNHTNQWASTGLKPASSIGIRNSDRSKFDMYTAEVSPFKYKKTDRKFINTELVTEDSASSIGDFIAFDIFFKNVSGAPKSDNLFFDDGTLVEFAEDTPDKIKEEMTSFIDSVRFGIVKIGSVSSKADVRVIQNQTCANSCEMLIYEPNSTSHTINSVENAQKLGITISNNTYVPTYAVKAAGNFLEHVNGHEGTGQPLDTEHFQLQRTITNFDKPIFQLPNAITKARVYIWVEGQDVDSLEAFSEGADLYVSLNFIKDLAGYQ